MGLNPRLGLNKDVLLPYCSCIDRMHRVKADESAHQSVIGSSLMTNLTYGSKIEVTVKLN